MNAVTAEIPMKIASADGDHGNPGKYLWLGIFGAILIVANLPLFSGTPSAELIFVPERCLSGEWWRVFTAPWVHVSWYNLALDAGTFLLLYASLQNRNIWDRIIYLSVCWMFSLVAALFSSPAIFTSGLCGLSGIAHGLMAITSCELLFSDDSDQTVRWVGLGALFLVAGKGIVEGLTGNVVLSFLHFGEIGTPIAVCHTGGILGGILAFVAVRYFRGREGASGMIFPCPSEKIHPH